MMLNTMTLTLKPEGELAKISAQFLRGKPSLCYTFNVSETPAECEVGIRGTLRRWVHPSEGVLYFSVAQGIDGQWSVKALTFIMRTVSSIASGEENANLLPGLVFTEGKGAMDVKIDCVGEADAAHGVKPHRSVIHCASPIC